MRFDQKNQNPAIPQVVPFTYEKYEFRTIIINDAPYFVARDVCNVLGLDDINKALLKLEDDEKLTRKLFVSGQNREFWLINESGLYTLILRSNKPEAKKFRKWVTSEVLPSIRKTGSYETTPSVPKPITAKALHEKLNLRMGYLDFLVRALVSGKVNEDYNLVDAPHTYVTDLMLQPAFADFMANNGYQTRTARLKEKPVQKLLKQGDKEKKPRSITIQIN
jgi:prophage antirepressor-like protein